MENVFAANPNIKELIVFEDGTCFINKGQGYSDAITYAKQTGKKYEVITRNQEEKPNKKDKK